MVKKTLKRYFDELEILDGVMITVMFSLFMIYNWSVFLNNPILNLLIVSIILAIIVFFMFLTVKDIFKNIDDMQISISLIMAILLLWTSLLGINIIFYQITSVFGFLFLCIFIRNLNLKLFYKSKKIKW